MPITSGQCSSVGRAARRACPGKIFPNLERIQSDKQLRAVKFLLYPKDTKSYCLLACFHRVYSHNAKHSMALTFNETTGDVYLGAVSKSPEFQTVYFELISNSSYPGWVSRLNYITMYILVGKMALAIIDSNYYPNLFHCDFLLSLQWPTVTLAINSSSLKD